MHQGANTPDEKSRERSQSGTANPRLDGLISRRMDELGLSENQLFLRLGLRSPERGAAMMRRIVSGTLEGIGYLREPLARTLQVPVSEVDAAIAVSRSWRRARLERLWRASFEPHAVLLTHPRPPKVAAAALRLAGAGKLIVTLPPSVPVVCRPRWVQSRLPARVPGFGDTCGFVLNHSPDHAVRFDAGGRPVEVLPSALRRGGVWSAEPALGAGR